VYIRHREFRGVGKSVRPLLFVILVTYLNSQFLLNYTNPSLFILKAHLLFMPTSRAALSAKALGFLIPILEVVFHIIAPFYTHQRQDAIEIQKKRGGNNHHH